MNLLRLIRIQTGVLLLGTLFAWGNFGIEFKEWIQNDDSVGCVVPGANPFLTACFYGAIFFLISFIISLLILRSYTTELKTSNTSNV